MASIAYCPQCGHVLSNEKDVDIKDYERSQCRFCGFDRGFAPIPKIHQPESFIKQFIEYIKFTRKLRTEEYFGRKPSCIEENHMHSVKRFGIDKNPLYSKELSIKTAQLKDAEYEERLRAESDARHKQEMDKLWDQVHQSMASKPRCPTCGSTNVKKLDVVDRAISVGTLGVLSNKINKSFKCKDCGYTW